MEFVDPDPDISRKTLKHLILVTERFPRDYDFMYRALLDMLRSFEGSANLGPFVAVWTELVNDILTSPQWLDLLFPEQCSADTKLVSAARASHYRRYLPAGQQTPDSPGSSKTSPRRAALVQDLLGDLATGDPSQGPPFLFLSRFYFFRDLLYSYFVDTELKPIQREIFHQCYLQRHNWRQPYAADYPYQGLERLGISGIKPTEERLARYDIAEYLRPGDQLLDIGSNNGLWALGLAPKVGHVDALEFNPYLVSIGNVAKEYLEASNISFVLGDFVDFDTDKQYDVVCSLANHCTIDGNLSIGFEEYMAKVFSLLRPRGILFFESHNVFGPGSGGPGDDGDLDAKFDIAERYFSVLKYKMTPAYVPAFDIDKLFVIMRRRDHYEPTAVRTLSLSEARDRYGY
jgi:SAM-dependent methyltransferase